MSSSMHPKSGWRAVILQWKKTPKIIANCALTWVVSMLKNKCAHLSTFCLSMWGSKLWTPLICIWALRATADFNVFSKSAINYYLLIPCQKLHCVSKNVPLYLLCSLLAFIWNSILSVVHLVSPRVTRCLWHMVVLIMLERCREYRWTRGIFLVFWMQLCYTYA